MENWYGRGFCLLYEPRGKHLALSAETPRLCTLQYKTTMPGVTAEACIKVPGLISPGGQEPNGVCVFSRCLGGLHLGRRCCLLFMLRYDELATSCSPPLAPRRMG